MPATAPRSGTPPDVRISLRNWDLAPWDNALHNGRLVLAGKRKVGIWDSLPLGGEGPSRVFSDRIGPVQFEELRGVALDDRYLYLADANGKISVWNGLPVDGTENPVRTFQAPGTPPNHLNSDGTYLCLTVQSNPPGAYVYRVADIAASGGSLLPYKSVTSSPQLWIGGQAASALTFGGSLAIANTDRHSVLLWKDVNDAGDPSKVVVLGQSAVSGYDPAIGASSLFMPASLAVDGNSLWVGEFKFSSRLLKFSRVATPHRWHLPVAFGGSVRAGGLAVVNHSTSTARLQITAFSDGGQYLDSAERTLDPGCQMSELISQLFQRAGVSPAWIRLESGTASLSAFCLFFDDRVRWVDGVAIGDSTLTDFVFAPGEDGDIALVNPGDSAAEFVLEYVGDGGDIVQSTSGTVPPLGRIVVASRALRASSAEGGYFRGRSSGGLLPYLTAFRGERMILQPGADAADAGAATKYLGHFVAGGGYTSRLGLVNLDVLERQFTVSLHGGDGALGTPIQVHLPPGGASTIAGAAPFGMTVNPESFLQGYVRVDGANGSFVGQAVIGDATEGAFGTLVTASGPRGGELRCAQAASTDLWYTGVALLNPTEQASPVYAILFDPRGEILASGNLVLPAQGRWCGLLSQLFAGLPAVPAGYLRIGSGQTGVTLALIGATDLSSLAAISP